MRTKVKKQKMKTSLGDKIFVVINSAILICLCIITLYPIWYVFCASMTSNTYLVSHPGILLWPHEMTFGVFSSTSSFWIYQYADYSGGIIADQYFDDIVCRILYGIKGCYV